MTAALPLSPALRYLADLAEIRGAHEKAAGLRRAADIVDAAGLHALTHPQDCTEADTEADEVGFAVSPEIRALAERGASESLAAARSGVPRLFRRLLDLNVITSAEAAALARAGILTPADVGAAVDDPGFHSETAQQVLHLAAGARDAAASAITLGRAWDLLDPLLADIARECPAYLAVTPSGDVRRVEPLVSGLVLVGCAHDPRAVLESIAAMPLVENVLHTSADRAIVVVQQTEVDIRVAAMADYGGVLFRTTGTHAHVRTIAARRARDRAARDESEIYAEAGLRFIAPELRHHTGEIEAAAADALPGMLIAREHIRGDLHMHTTYSDGRDTLAAMVAACVALGYEYIAITDHSESAAAARTVARDDLARQRDEIAMMRERHPSTAILQGVEVDIMPDGRLDFPDSLLEPLDIVLASLHDPAGQDGATLTRRCLDAIRHPLVNVITHPANRLVGRRDGYALDFEAIYDAAAESGTALEIDGAPSHLDLDGTHARSAARAGVTLVIDSDCHRVQVLDRQMRLGIGTARRGWVEPHQVLNTRPVEAVRAFVKAKRAGNH